MALKVIRTHVGGNSLSAKHEHDGYIYYFLLFYGNKLYVHRKVCSVKELLVFVEPWRNFFDVPNSVRAVASKKYDNAGPMVWARRGMPFVERGLV